MWEGTSEVGDEEDRRAVVEGIGVEGLLKWDRIVVLGRDMLEADTVHLTIVAVAALGILRGQHSSVTRPWGTVDISQTHTPDSVLDIPDLLLYSHSVLLVY